MLLTFPIASVTLSLEVHLMAPLLRSLGCDTALHTGPSPQLHALLCSQILACHMGRLCQKAELLTVILASTRLMQNPAIFYALQWTGCRAQQEGPSRPCGGPSLSTKPWGPKTSPSLMLAAARALRW